MHKEEMRRAATNDTVVVRAHGLQAHPQQPKATERAWAEHFPVIVHCHLRWDFVWQRPQQIFSRLASLHRVLFIEDAMQGQGDARLEITEPYANVVRVVPILPEAQMTTVDAQSKRVLAMLHRAMDSHPLLSGRFDDAVQWFYSPMTSPVFLGEFGGRGVVYDCMDELANFRFAPPELRQREAWLMSKADVVFTGGRQLYDSKSRHHDNVHFYGCGVDAVHFGKARLPETEVPAFLSTLAKPVFGYYGVIDERIDYALVEALADRFPEASIAMVGPLAKVEQSQLPSRPNLHWLGQQSYDLLPAIVKGFDVCLMPFALNEATQFINPTKTLEYMAGGKPIVSTAVPDVVTNFTPIVDIARSHETFCDAVEHAWTSPSEGFVEDGIVMAANSTWDATVAAMAQDIRDAVVPQTSRVASAAKASA